MWKISERLACVLKKEPHELHVLLGTFKKNFFELSREGGSENSNSLFSRTPMDASKWMNKKRYE